MGSGKTAASINFINNSESDEKFIYVTPYLNEVERVISSCPDKKFKEPQRYGTKINGIKYLLQNGENIATTHSLFHLFDDEILELCYSQGYTLFMDEVTDVVEPYEIDKNDIEVLFENFITIDEKTKLLSWREDKKDYSFLGKFIDIKRLCENGSLAMYGDQIMMWMFPIKIFKAFSESYILTYMFDAQIQKYYYDFYNLEYKYMSVEGSSLPEYHFTENKINTDNHSKYKNLINIIDNDKLNRIGELDYSLSKGWYGKHKDDALFKTLKKNTCNFFIHIADNPSSNNNLWTTFKDYKDKLKGKGYTKGFAPANARATNEFRDRHNVAYLINRYFNPVIKQFFISQNIKVDEDMYALSEMLQFIWRSAIRCGEKITIYIPSKRMRTLLINWMDGDC